ncbi:hypothetical protein JXA48_03485 [Candidatus Woesearchaeota archaeon]|nr:hypothetical protein [Candidatus Woesearchaeota archaeon]
MKSKKDAKKDLSFLDKSKQFYHKALNTKQYQKRVEFENLKEQALAKLSYYRNIYRINDIFDYYKDQVVDHVEKSVTQNDSDQLSVDKSVIHSRQKIQRLRQIVTNAYRDNPDGLKRYFNYDLPVFAGLASSAYFQLTGDISPCLSLVYGGLGSVVNDSPENLKIGRCQFHYSTIGKHAFGKASLDDLALMGSEVFNYADKELSFKDRATRSVFDIFVTKSTVDKNEK